MYDSKGSGQRGIAGIHQGVIQPDRCAWPQAHPTRAGRPSPSTSPVDFAVVRFRGVIIAIESVTGLVAIVKTPANSVLANTGGIVDCPGPIGNDGSETASTQQRLASVLGTCLLSRARQQLMFQECYPGVQGRCCLIDHRLGITRGNVLRTVPVECRDVYHKPAFDTGSIRGSG